MGSNWFKLLLLVLFLAHGLLTHAQELEGIELEVQKILENNDLENQDNDFVDLHALLLTAKVQPLDLNKASLSDLRVFPFLNPLLITSLIAYRDKVKRIGYYEELQQISGFSLEHIQLLKQYTFISKNNSAEYFSGPLIKSEITTGAAIQRSRGFQRIDSLTGARYMGDAQYFLNRLLIMPNQRCKIVLTLEKDPGEVWWNNKYGFDFIAGAIEYRGLRKFVPQLLVGDYKLQIGQGIALSTGFSFGKSADVLNLAQRPTTLGVYTSSNEYLNLRGASGVFRLGNMSLLPFVSYKGVDASIVNEDADVMRVGSLQKTGLHRTIAERENRNSVSELIYGLGLEFRKDNFQLGGLLYSQKFSIPFSQGNEPYRNYYFNAAELQNSSIFGSYSFKSLYLFGEYAKTIGNGSAGIYGVMTALSSKISVVIMHRHYASDFYSYYSQSIKEAGRNTAEKAIFTGLNLRLNNKLSLSFYSDAYFFPWLRYGVNGPSKGNEFLAQVIYSFNKEANLSFRYRFKMWEENSVDNASLRYLVEVLRQNFRINAEYTINNIRLKNRLEYCLFQKANSRSSGILAYQDIEYKLSKHRLSLNSRFTYFNTDDFNAAIYSTERSLNSMYVIPVFHYNGVRTYFNIKKGLMRSMNLGLRYSFTNYMNRTEIGSGNDIIDGAFRSDYLVQLEFKL